MKKIILGLIAVIFISISCKKEEPYTEPSLTILSLSSDTVNVSDTLRITYEISGFDSYLDIEVLIDGYTCEALSNTGSVIEVIVPYGVRDYDREISLKYQDYVSPTYYLNITINPKVTDFFPKSGVGGDTLRIVGFGFDKFVPVKIVRINSLPAEIISSNDTLLIVLIPEGCGSGKVRLQNYYPSGTCNGEPRYLLSKEVICGGFTYNFKSYSGNVYPTKYKKTLSPEIEEYTIERFNGVFQRKVYSLTKYDVYKYHDNIIDSIIHFEDEVRIGYETFLVHAGLDEIEHNFYNGNGIRYKYHIYKLHNKKLVEWDFYEFSEQINDFYHSAHNFYSQEFDRYKLDRTVYDIDGSIHYHPIFEGFLDIQNTPLDFNIPGYPLSHEDVWIYNGERTYLNYYNEYGLLVKRVWCDCTILYDSEANSIVEEFNYE